MKKTLIPVITKSLMGLMVAVGLSTAFAQAKKESDFCAPGYAASAADSDGL